MPHLCQAHWHGSIGPAQEDYGLNREGSTPSKLVIIARPWHTSDLLLKKKTHNKTQNDINFANACINSGKIDGSMWK